MTETYLRSPAHGSAPGRQAASTAAAGLPLRLSTAAERLAHHPCTRVVHGEATPTRLTALHPDPTDHRACLVSITEAGTELLDAMRRERAGRLAPGVAHLQPQQIAALLAALPALESLADHITAKI